MIIIPLGVIWAGYTLGWFGWGTLHFPGPGLLDLIIPGRAGAAAKLLTDHIAAISAAGGIVADPSTGTGKPLASGFGSGAGTNPPLKINGPQ